jgi:hypothetical protein
VTSHRLACIGFDDNVTAYDGLFFRRMQEKADKSAAIAASDGKPGYGSECTAYAPRRVGPSKRKLNFRNNRTPKVTSLTERRYGHGVYRVMKSKQRKCSVQEDRCSQGKVGQAAL